MSAKENIASLKAQITKATTVEKSAEKLITSFAALLAAAVLAAIANGATAEELQPLADLGSTLETESDALTAAVLANTPADPEARKK